MKKMAILLLALILVACGFDSRDSMDKQPTDIVTLSAKSYGFEKQASREDIISMKDKFGTYFKSQLASNSQKIIGIEVAHNKEVAFQEVAAANVPKAIFRFFNTKTGTHFFTMSMVERDYIQKTFPFFNYEGSKFLAYSDSDPTLSPVYRFFNKITGTHFFTINQAERDHVIVTWPTIFNYEGIAWYASTVNATGLVPVYRFFNTRTGTHFYTSSAAERDHIVNTWNWFLLEGVAYYVLLDTNPPEPPASIPVADCGIVNFKTDMIASLNAFRSVPQMCGGISMPAVGSLAWDNQLQQAATVHSSDMANNNFFSHTGSDGNTFRQRLPAAGYNYISGGENIAAGQTSVAQVMADWIASPSHCANMMQPSFRDMAVSCVSNPSSVYKLYWTMTLGIR